MLPITKQTNDNMPIDRGWDVFCTVGDHLRSITQESIDQELPMAIIFSKSG
jgi:hypothetical protein